MLYQTIPALLTACCCPHELASVLALAHVVVAHDGEVVLGVEAQSCHRIGVNPEFVHVQVLVGTGGLAPVPESEILGLTTVEARDPHQGDGVVGGVQYLKETQTEEPSL